jgi:hypothetical protein
MFDIKLVKGHVNASVGTFFVLSGLKMGMSVPTLKCQSRLRHTPCLVITIDLFSFSHLFAHSWMTVVLNEAIHS